MVSCNFVLELFSNTLHQQHQATFEEVVDDNTDSGRKPNNDYFFFHHPKSHSAGVYSDSESTYDVDDVKQDRQEQGKGETYQCDWSKSSTSCLIATLVPISCQQEGC